MQFPAAYFFSMEYTRHTQALDQLREVAKKTDSVCVGFSGGKDSLVCIDLCCKVFKNVYPFFMYFIPGLDCCEAYLEYARKRWNVEIKQYPHWLLARVIKNGIYCNPTRKMADAMPDFTTHDIYKIAMHETGVRHLVTGAKDSDSMWRRRYFSITKMPELLFPIKPWNKFDVISYLKLNDIPVPASTASASGVDMSRESLMFMHDNWPTDFERIRAFFPFIDALIYREKWFPNGKKTNKKLLI